MNNRRQHNRIKTKAMKLHAIKVRSFVILSLMVVVLLSSYIALIGLSVKNVVIRKEAEARSSLLRAEVSEMEHEYITRVGDITLARAGGVGLGTVASKSYTERKILVGQAY
jgi:hypothetical protein